jgi:hypothetical protein
MASNDSLPNTQVVVEPKAKNKDKTKKEKGLGRRRGRVGDCIPDHG